MTPTVPPVEFMPKYGTPPRNMGGNEQHVYRFPNGYCASVVRGPFSYGGPSGLWEIAVGKYHGPDDADWDLCYDTPVTSDVLGWQTDADLAAVLVAIAALPAVSS